MRKWMLAAGAAALAIATPGLAEKGQGRGGGGNKDHSAHSTKSGGGNARAERGNKGGSGDRVRTAQNDRGNKGRGGDQLRASKADRGGGHGRDQVKVQNRGNDNVRVARVKGDDKVRAHGRNWDDGNKAKARGRDWDDDVRVVRVDRDDDEFWGPRWDGNGLRRGFIDGCPPGLAKKGNGCLPPGQAKKIVGTPLNAALGLSPLGGPYRSWYRDNDDYFYRWDDDYIYRVRRDGDLIDAMFPFANRDYYYYPVGVTYPDYFNYYNVPYQYQSFYPDGGDYMYRYGDGAIYMVDPQTQMIQGIAALLTGAPLAVGQPLPPTYGVYNVPMAYRSTYYDTPQNMYRYNDGYIYRVDPATMLITAVIDAIV